MRPDARPPSSPPLQWSDLPLDVPSYIFGKLGAAIDILMGPVGLVCKSWLDAAKMPNLYRHIDMERHEFVYENFRNHDILRSMAKMAIDRSDGQLEVLAGWGFVDDELLCYIAERYPLFWRIVLLLDMGEITL
jgi:hypothetical protein